MIAAAMAAVFLAGCGSKGGEELANVNGETIATEDLHKYVMTKPSFTVQIPNANPTNMNLAGTPAFQGLKDLIERRVLMQIAKDEGVAPTAEEINAELETRKKLNAQYASARLAMGMTLDQIKEELATELAGEKIITKGINVTMEEVEDYIKKNPNEFVEPETVKVFYMQVSKPETMKKVEAELASGKPFQSVALQYSESPSVREDNASLNNGRPVPVNSLNPALAKEINKLKEHNHTGWIDAQNAHMMFYVDERTPAKKMNIDDNMKKMVQRRMKIQKGSIAVDLNKRISDRIAAEGDKYQVSGSLKTQWDQYVQALKRAKAAAAVNN
jgi:hypothetical protein